MGSLWLAYERLLTLFLQKEYVSPHLMTGVVYLMHG
jgi:hypothetical protein